MNLKNRYSPWIGLALTSLSLCATPGDLVWSFNTGEIIYSSPAIGDLGQIVFGCEDGKVYCLNPDRTLKWQFTQATDWVDASPVIDNETVYVGSWDNYFYAINLEDGSLKWSLETANLILASATVDSAHNVYIGSNDGIFYSLAQNGELNWIYGLTSGYAIDSTAALSTDEETIYFGADDGNLYAIETATGSEKWTFSVDVPANTTDPDIEINTSPAIGEDGSIYFGSRNNYLYALNTDGSLKWSFQATAEIDSSPAVSKDNRIIFACRDGYLYCLDSEGFQLWETLIGDVFYASPAINANNEVIIGAYAGSSTTGAATEFLALSTESGDEIWSYRVSNYNDSSPNIAPDGSIYVGSHDGNLYKIEGNSSLAVSPWPRIHRDRKNRGNPGEETVLSPIDYFPDISYSREKWFQVSWFGAGWLALSTLPYVYHIDHEFIYLTSPSNGGLWFYDQGLGWLYSNETSPNYYFSPISQSWILHLTGTSGQGKRWFYDFSLKTFATADSAFWFIK